MGALGGPIQLRQRRPSKTYRRFVQTAISVKVTVTQSEGIPFQILRRQSEIVHVGSPRRSSSTRQPPVSGRTITPGLRHQSGTREVARQCKEVFLWRCASEEFASLNLRTGSRFNWC